MRDYKIYIVDFDGTLIDSYEGLPIFYRYAFGAFGYSISDEEAYHFSKMSLEAAYIEKINKPELEKDFTKKCYEIVESDVLLPHNKLFKDTLPFINYIKEKGAPLVIVTGNSRVHVKKVLKNLGLSDYFTDIITSEDLKVQKPDPEGIKLVLEKLHYFGELNEVCYIGDAWNDFLAAKNANVTPILLDRFNEYQENEDYLLIHSLTELMN